MFFLVARSPARLKKWNVEKSRLPDMGSLISDPCDVVQVSNVTFSIYFAEFYSSFLENLSQLKLLPQRSKKFKKRGGGMNCKYHQKSVAYINHLAIFDIFLLKSKFKRVDCLLKLRKISNVIWKCLKHGV